MSPAPEDLSANAEATAGSGESSYRADCPCREKRCPNFERCVPCRAKHGAKGGKPACER